jgi:exopolysaccharide production protein ExoY
LRRTSIDELPQLINILRGEMSVVGPRPIVEDEVRHYGTAIFDYMSVRPGLTGLWQVNGRSDVGYKDRVRLDQQYVRQRNLVSDLHIIWRTIGVVLRREGSY